jgi:lysozyme family protein
MMAANNFQACLAETLKWEGGWADHPKDPGGATMKGITLATYRRWKPGATKTQLRNISRDMVEKIYKADYWVPVRGDTLAKGVDLATFDYGVNSGPATARKKLLQVVGGSDVDTIKKLCKARLTVYQSLKTWVTFGKGWTNRITAIEAKAVSWALGAQNSASQHVSEILKQEANQAKATSKKQSAGATGTAAGGAGGYSVSDPDQIAAWVVAALIIAAIGLVGWLIWCSHVNKKRSEAYNLEAAA